MGYIIKDGVKYSGTIYTDTMPASRVKYNALSGYSSDTAQKALDDLYNSIKSIASSTLPQDYVQATVKAAVDAYVAANNGGYVTKDEVKNIHNVLGMNSIFKQLDFVTKANSTLGYTGDFSTGSNDVDTYTITPQMVNATLRLVGHLGKGSVNLKWASFVGASGTKTTWSCASNGSGAGDYDVDQTFTPTETGILYISRWIATTTIKVYFANTSTYSDVADNIKDAIVSLCDNTNKYPLVFNKNITYNSLSELDCTNINNIRIVVRFNNGYKDLYIKELSFKNMTGNIVYYNGGTTNSITIYKNGNKLIISTTDDSLNVTVKIYNLD